MPISKESAILHSILGKGYYTFNLLSLTRQDIAVIKRLIERGTVEADTLTITLSKREEA
jgi:hypothetical protein